MAPRSKLDKFFIYAAKKSGWTKGRRLLGINYAYVGGPVSVQDLIDFLKEKNIEASKVQLPSNFSTFAKE